MCVPIDSDIPFDIGIDDIDIETWIDMSKDDWSVVNLSDRRVPFSFHPLTGAALGCTFTIYWENQANFQETNCTFKALWGIRHWKGNVLCIKSASINNVVNVEEEDMELIQELVLQSAFFVMYSS